MNGQIGKTHIDAIEISHHTGTVWSATFPYPPPAFLADMDWLAFDSTTGRNLDWFTQSMARHVDTAGKAWLELRFDDRSRPPLTDADRPRLAARLGHPRS